MSRWITGGAPPSAVANISGSTVISPSWRFQYVHIGWSRATSPDGVWMSIVIGRPSRPQKRLAHGPGATTTCSPTAIGPCSVSTAVTVSSSAELEAGHLGVASGSGRPPRGTCRAGPCTDSRLKAKPPWCSCRQTVTPFARQSGKSAFMCASTSASPRSEVGAVADALVALVDGGEVALLHLSGRARCSRRRCSGRPRGRTPTPRRRPASARSSRAGSSCCGRRRRRCRWRLRPGSPSRARRRPRRSRAPRCRSSTARW